MCGRQGWFKPNFSLKRWKYGYWVRTYPKILVMKPIFQRGIFLLLLAAALGLLVPGLRYAGQVDNSLTIWFLEDDPGLKAYRDFQQQFGNDEVVIAMVFAGENGSLLNPKDIAAMQAMTRELETTFGVRSVIGPANLEVVQPAALGFVTRPVFDSLTPLHLSDSLLSSMPLLKKQVFLPDYSAARFLALLDTLPDFDAHRGEIIAGIHDIVKRHFPGERSGLGGIGVVFSALNDYSRRDFGLFLGLAYLIMCATLWVIYRRWQVVVFAVGIVLAATWIILGIYGLAGLRLNLMTTLIPILIALLGTMDAMHLITERNRLLSTGLDLAAATARALREEFRPCLFTTLTTMAGFLVLVFSPMAILKQFGLFSALGIGLCLVATYSFGYLWLPLIGGSPGRALPIANGLERLLHFVLKNRRGVGLAWMLVFLGCVAGLFQLKNDTFTLGFLPGKSEVVRDHDRMEAQWGPYIPLEWVVRPAEGIALTDPRLVAAARQFEDSARTLSRSGEVTGFHTLLVAGMQARFGASFEERMNNSLRIRQVAEGLSVAFPQLTAVYLNPEKGVGRMTLYGKMSSARQLTSALDTLHAMGKAAFGDLAEISPAGYQPMYARITNYVTRSQVSSLAGALVLVFFLVWIFIRNARLAALATLSNVMPIAIILGLMGWFGIYLDLATASVAAIALSFCIDDTIHFVWHYHHLEQAHREPEPALAATTRQVGPAIVLTSMLLFLGFGVMGFAELKTVSLFGLLSCLAVAAALAAQLTLFPLLVHIFSWKK